MRGWKKIFHANGNNKKAGAAILVPETIHFKIKDMEKDKVERQRWTLYNDKRINTRRGYYTH